MTLPNLLSAEFRHAFQACARQHTARRQQSRQFRALQPLLKRDDSRPRREVQSSPGLEVTNKNNSPADGNPPQPASSTVLANETVSSRELVPDSAKPASVFGKRRTDLPMKIIPKAQITPEVTLTPKEQLQIEFMTRRPPRTEAKKSILHASHVAGSQLLTFV